MSVRAAHASKSRRYVAFELQQRHRTKRRVARWALLLWDLDLGCRRQPLPPAREGKPIAASQAPGASVILLFQEGRPHGNAPASFEGRKSA